MRKVILLSIIGLFVAASQMGCSLVGGCGCGGDAPKESAGKPATPSCSHAKQSGAKDAGDTCGMSK